MIDSVENGGTLAVVIAIIEFAKFLISRYKNKKNNGELKTGISGVCKHNCNLSADMQSKINDLHILSEKQAIVCEMLNKTDNNGTPLVFSHRSAEEDIKDMKKSLTNICLNSKKQIDLLERIERKLE